MSEFYVAWQASIDHRQADLEHQVALVMCHLIAGGDLIAPSHVLDRDRGRVTFAAHVCGTYALDAAQRAQTSLRAGLRAAGAGVPGAQRPGDPPIVLELRLDSHPYLVRPVEPQASRRSAIGCR